MGVIDDVSDSPAKLNAVGSIFTVEQIIVLHCVFLNVFAKESK